MLKFFTTLILLIVCIQVRAQSLAETLLERDIMASSKTMMKEVNLYNYFFLQEAWPELETIDGRNAYIKRYLSYRAGSFWNSEFTDDSPKNYAAGAGLYFAIDPLISEPYGNSFIQITIPVGTKYVNVVSAIPVKKDTIQALIIEGLVKNQSEIVELYLNKGFYRDTLRSMVLPKFSKFRQAVQDIFTRNNIQFVEYNFNTSLMGFCKKHSYSAFNFVGQVNELDKSNALLDSRFDKVNLHSNAFNFANLNINEVEQKNSIVKFRGLLQNISVLLKQGKLIKKEFLATYYTETEIQNIKNSTFSCEM